MKFQVRDKDREILENLLFKPLKQECGCKLWIFGSRARVSPSQTEQVEAIIEEIESLQNSSLAVQFNTEAGS